MASLLQFIVSLSLIVTLFALVKKWRLNYEASKPRKNLPPSPRKLPLIGNFHQIGSLPYRSLQSLSRRYGPLMLLHFGRVPVLVVSSADAAREIMKNQDLIFSNRPRSSITDKVSYYCKDITFGPYGEYWRQIRSICVLQLLTTKKVQSLRRVREEETSIMVEKIRRLGRSSRVINLSSLLASLTTGVVCRGALGRKYEGEGEGDIRMLLDELGQILGSACIGDYIPCLSWIDRVRGLHAKLDKVANGLDEFAEGVVKEHRDQESGNRVLGDQVDGELDFVDRLLELQRENKNTSPVDDVSIKALIVDAFAAGTDTTYTALEWTVIELLKHPESMKKLQDEARTIGATKEEITEGDLEKMQYMKLVIKESLRLHPPLPLLLPRESAKDTKIMGYDIAAGTQVIVNSWAIGRDPSSWEDPEKFRPERFLDTNIDYKGSHFELIPFGAGRRGCPGVTFAMVVYELALAKLVHQFDLMLPNGERVEDLDMTEVNGITVRRKCPLMVVATPLAP